MKIYINREFFLNGITVNLINNTLEFLVKINGKAEVHMLQFAMHISKKMLCEWSNY